MSRSNTVILLVGAVVVLALPAIAGAQVTPFSFVDEDVRMEFPTESAPSGGSEPPTPLVRVFDLRSFIKLDLQGPFNPAAEGATLTIRQGSGQDSVTLFTLPMPAGTSSGWRVDDDGKRIRFDGDTGGVSLSVDFLRLDGGTFTGTLPINTEIAFNFEGDADAAPVITCEDGIASTIVVKLQIGSGDESKSDETEEFPAQCD